MDPYEELANAIVLQAVKDYRNAELQQDRNEIERFFRSDWFDLLTTIDPEALIHKLKEEKKHECERLSVPGQVPGPVYKCEDSAVGSAE